MAIFGNMYNSTTGLLIHKETSLDIFFNYLFSAICLILLIISSICNLLVFLHHRKGKQNISAILFQILTANDFLTCLAGVPYMLYLFAAQDLDNVDTEVESWQIWYTVLRSSLFRWSVLIGAVLGVVRSIKILRPFLKITTWCVLPFLIAGAILTTGAIILNITYNRSTLLWNIYTQQVLRYDSISPTLIILLLSYTLTICMSLGSALASMVGLYQHDVQRQKQGLARPRQCAACKTVMLINLLITTQFLITLVSLTVTWTVPDQVVVIHYLEFLQFPLSNCTMSAFNPVIILTRSGAFSFEKILKRVTRRSTEASTLDQVATSSV